MYVCVCVCLRVGSWASEPYVFCVLVPSPPHLMFAIVYVFGTSTRIKYFITVESHGSLPFRFSLLGCLWPREGGGGTSSYLGPREGFGNNFRPRFD